MSVSNAKDTWKDLGHSQFLWVVMVKPHQVKAMFFRFSLKWVRNPIEKRHRLTLLLPSLSLGVVRPLISIGHLKSPVRGCSLEGGKGGKSSWTRGLGNHVNNMSLYRR